MKPLVVIDGRPVRPVHIEMTVETVKDGYDNGCIVRSVVPGTIRHEVVLSDGTWMLFKTPPMRSTRPSGRLLYTYGKPDSTSKGKDAR